MTRKGVLLYALAFVLLAMLRIDVHAQTPSSTLAELKLKYPISHPRTEKLSFTLPARETLNISLNLPVLKGSHKGWIGIINAVTKQEMWGMMVDATAGPLKESLTKIFESGKYSLIVEYADEMPGPVKAEWAGSLLVSR